MTWDAGGLEPAAAYLTLMAGNDASNTASSWGINAISESTDLTRHEAKRAVDALVKAGLVSGTGRGQDTRPHQAALSAAGRGEAGCPGREGAGGGRRRQARGNARRASRPPRREEGMAGKDRRDVDRNSAQPERRVPAQLLCAHQGDEDMVHREEQALVASAVMGGLIATAQLPQRSRRSTDPIPPPRQAAQRRNIQNFERKRLESLWWRGLDSNQRRVTPTDLQSHSTL